MKRSFLLNFDEKWCGNNQVSATLLQKVVEEEAIQLAVLRLCLAFCLLAEIMGFFCVTLGLSSARPVWVFLLGIILLSCGTLFAAFFQNKSGIFLSLELQKYLGKIRASTLEIRAFLAERGCSEQEVNALQSLPAEVYQTELNSYQRARTLNIGIPLSCGCALLINGDLITSLVVIVLGLASFPIGEKFFRESTFRRESELRLGLAAQFFEYVDQTYKNHLLLTIKVNFLSQLPLLLFAFRFVFDGNGQLLSSFFGLTQGLAGLTGTLSFQKARVVTMKTTQMASHLIQALSSPFLIISPRRWKEHCALVGNTQDVLLSERNGVWLKDFAPNLPFQDKEMFSISSFIPSGSVCLIRALSGQGKTTLLSALSHFIEHKGDLFLVKDHKLVDVHTLSFEEFQSRIFFFKEENVEKSFRLIDLFKPITCQNNHKFLGKNKTNFSPLLVDLAWKSPDNLVEQEIKNIESKKQSVFPAQMLEFLKELRVNQAKQIMHYFKESGGNLINERIVPERIFSTLSSGEKRRILATLALEFCKVFHHNLVILDEPLAHLDSTNIDHQLKVITQILKLPEAPAILLISHQCIAEIKENFSDLQEINL